MAELDDLRAKLKAPKKSPPPVQQKVAVVGEHGGALMDISATIPTSLEDTPELLPEEPKRRQVLIAPNKKLTTKCKPVKEIDDNIRRLAQEMEDFLRYPPKLSLRIIGITAPQLGECVRMLTIMLNPQVVEIEDAQITTIIDPVLVYAKKLHLVDESCLSLPGPTFQLKRPKIVKVRGMILTGESRSFKGHGLTAQMLMHELDHLDGLLLDVTGEVKHG